MSILGLDGAPEQPENIFKRIFWPRNDPYEADSLGQQGFWVCIAVAILAMLATLFSGHPFVALLVLGFYWLGGMGVREGSLPAAVVLSIGYVLSMVVTVIAGRMPGLLDIAIGVVLLANVRGTWITSQWQRKGDPELFPHRLHSTLRDKLVDQWPAMVWPRATVIFYLLATCYLTLLVFGCIRLAQRRAQAPHPMATALPVRGEG